MTANKSGAEEPRGGGSSVPVRTPGGSECGVGTSGTDQSTSTPSLTPTQERDNVQYRDGVDVLDDALLAAGVFALSRRLRRAAAEALHAEGITPGNILQLERWLQAGEPSEGKARRYLAGLLSSAGGAREALEDLRRRGELRAPDAPYDRNGSRNKVAWNDRPSDAEQARVWEHDRMCRIAWCRVNSDRRSIDEVAAELGVKRGTLTAMLDRGRVLSAPPKKEPKA